jgi:lysophospholipid acyltransferase (LPLAT)-like uncharacterized protein
MVEEWRSSPWKRFQVAAIAAIGYPLIALLGSTLRWRVEGLEHYDAIVRSGRQPVMGFWHGRILTATYYFRRRGIVVITSENFDGEWIARIIERFGYGTARGSTTRGASKATIQLVRALRSGRPAGFTLDGPKGPARVAQPGAVWLAGATGHPLLPFHLEAARHWTIGSWDRTQIPKPFSTVALVVGEPLEVPGGLDDSGLEQVRQALEACLSNAEARCRQLLAAGS